MLIGLEITNKAEECLDCRRKHPNVENFLGEAPPPPDAPVRRSLTPPHTLPSATPSVSTRWLRRLISVSSTVGPSLSKILDPPLFDVH